MSNLLVISIVLLVAVVFIVILISKTSAKSKNNKSRKYKSQYGDGTQGSDVVQCPRCGAFVPAAGGRSCLDKECPLKRP